MKRLHVILISVFAVVISIVCISEFTSKVKSSEDILYDKTLCIKYRNGVAYNPALKMSTTTKRCVEKDIVKTKAKRIITEDIFGFTFENIVDYTEDKE